MNSSSALVPGRHSLRWRLPLLISVLVASVLATFLWTAYRRVEETLVLAAGERAQSAADQIAGLIDGTRTAAQVEALGGDQDLRRFLETRTPESRKAAEARLDALAGTSLRRVELWDAAGVLLLEDSVAGTNDDGSKTLLPRGAAPTGPGISPLQSAADTVFTDVVAELKSGASATPLGYLRVRSTFSESQPGLFSRLVGNGAVVRVGNRTGDVWTNFSRAPSAARVDLQEPGVKEYTSSGGEARIGAVALVQETPWSTWVEFPRSAIVAPARAFLQRMLVLGVVFVAVAGVLAVMLAGRITTPLSEINTAAAAIAGGDYSRRVSTDRRDEIGQLASTFNAMAVDVQKSADDLKKSEESYRRLFASNPHPMYVYDVETLRFLDVNEMATLRYGYSRDEFLAMTLKDIRPESEWPALLEYVAARATTAEVAGIWKHRTKHGDLLDVEVSSHELIVDGRRACAVLAHDVTERLRAQAALRESEARFRAMAETMPHIVWTARPDGTLDYLNRRWNDYTGVPLDAVQSGGWTDLLHPDDREETQARWTTALATGQPQSASHRMRAAHGAYRWHIWRAAPLKDESGAVLVWVGTSTDVDDQRRDQEALRELNAELEGRVKERTQELEAANRELESFSYSVSHDLRAPLRHVQGYVEMLTAALGDQLAEKPRRYLQTITDATVEMGQLIDDLLAFSRMGRVQMSQGAVPLDSVVQACIGALELTMRGRNITWKIAPLPTVIGDPSMIKQVFANLLDNAIKYTRHRDPAVIEIGCAGESDGEVVLFVRDNGAGFDMQYAHKLFGVFQRLHGSNEFEGTGIGLATVRRILARHGGRTWAEGKVNEGATVYFTITAATPLATTSKPS